MAENMDDKATIATLTRQLEAAKEALTEIGLLPRGTAAFSLECAQEIASDALATLSTPAEKPEAVETGEPVAWESDPYCQLCDQEQKHCGCTYPEWGPSPYARGYAAGRAASPTPPAQDDARTRALEISGEMVTAAMRAFEKFSPKLLREPETERLGHAVDRQGMRAAIAAALALPQTAGDAT